MRKLLIIGAGGHGKVCAEIAKKMNYWDEISFLDDEKKGIVLDYEIIGSFSDLEIYADQYDMFVGIGDNNTREDIFRKLTIIRVAIPNLIDPSAIISKHVSLGKGNVIMPGVVINTSTVIGNGNIINTSSSIDHDCVIEDYIHISPGVTLSGNVTINRKTWIGSGTVVINEINVGQDIVVGAGSLVIKSLIEPGTYFGSPAKKITNHE